MNPSKQIEQGFLLLFLTFFWLSSGQAQQYFENPIVLKDAQVGHVTDAVIDNNGFLWIAGTDGLNRFDGHQHKYFRHDPNDSLSLYSNFINDLFFDEENNQLWIATTHIDKSGISILDLATEKIKNIRFDEDGSSGLAGRGLNWICKDRFGSDWISVWTNGLIKYFPEQDSIIRIRYQPIASEAGLDVSRVNNFIGYSFDVLNDSIMWIGTGDGVLKFNVLTHQFTRYPIKESQGGDYAIKCLLHHSDNQVYVGTWSNGLYRFDPKVEKFTKIEMDFFSYSPTVYRTNIRGLVSKSSTHLWVTTDAGLMEYDILENKVTALNKNDYTKEIHHGVFQIDQKNRALYWRFNSLFIFDPLRQQNQVYSHDTKKQKELKGFIVRQIVEEETTGKLLIAAQYSEGLYRLDLKTEEWEVFPLPKSYFKEWEEAQIWDVLKTKGGDIFVLISSYGIYQVSEKEKKLVPWELQPNMKGIGSHRMIEDTEGNIWIGTSNEGVFKVDPNIKTIRHFKKEFWHPDSLGIGIVKNLQEDRNGNIWICATGYSVYDIQKDTIYSFPYFIPDKKTYYQLYDLGIDGNGNVWIGSKDKGIGITDANHPEKGIVSYLDKTNGLKTDGSYRLLLDQKKNVWSLRDGLSKINPDRSTIQHFNSSYFSFTELWSMAQLANGNIVLGDRKGISIFNPDSLRVNETLAQPYILSFKVFNEERELISSPFHTTDIYLKPYENFFSLEFSALNRIFFGRTQFLYQLEGVDPEWVDPINRRYVGYTNIPGGSYNFKLKAKNNEGVWNKTPYVLSIHIAIPWYQSWWAYISYILLFFGILYYWYRFRLNRRLEKEEALRLQELATFKTRFYSNITHEFRTPLTIIEGMANELENHPDKASEKNLSLIKKNSQSLLSLVNQMLDLSKLQAGKVAADQQQDDVILFIKYLVETNESYANLKHIGLQFYSEEQEIWTDFDAQKLEQILTNLISNAVKFTSEYGKILVVAKKIILGNNPCLELVVKDNGIGIPSEQLPYIFDRFHQAKPIHANQGTGIGLALVKELVTILDGTIRVESELDKGTSVILRFPIRNNAPFIPKTSNHTFEPLVHMEALLNTEHPIPNNELPILLIIEDNEDVTYYLKTCLEDKYQIITSRNGKKGVEKALEELPDIVISDVMMPEMDGFEVCKTLKEDERTSHIPIILLTAKATSEDKLIGLTQGADAYLIKPFEKKELIVQLNKLLEIRRTLQKKYSSALISSQPSIMAIKNKEDTFIEKVEKIILAHLEEEDFSIDELIRELHLSRSQVHRKIKSLTGKSTSIYVRSIRLHKAKELFKETEMNVTEIAYAVGFKSASYFSQAFKEVFGESPSKYSK